MLGVAADGEPFLGFGDEEGKIVVKAP